MNVDNSKISWKGRLLSLIIFVMIAGCFIVLWASGRGLIDLSPYIGICGFKQRFQLPCPGCGWTHAAEAFVGGRITEAFYTQPAAAVFCCIALCMCFFSLHIGLFGIDSMFLKRLLNGRLVGFVVLFSAIIILCGWAVTLARAIGH